MIKKVFYNASLARSGSTLLQNILGQNPLIYASPTSPLLHMLDETRKPFTHTAANKSQIRENYYPAYRSFLLGAINGWYSALTQKPFAIDKNRTWMADIRLIKEYDDNPKIICFVRDLRGVFASMEKRFRKTPLLDNEIKNYYEWEGMHVLTRIDRYMKSNMTIHNLGCMYDYIQTKDTGVLFVKFEEFCESPDEIMKIIYDYLELPYYQHDFNNIQQLTWENDSIYTGFADHKIKPKLEPIKNDYIDILTEEGCDKIYEAYPWFYEYFNYKK